MRTMELQAPIVMSARSSAGRPRPAPQRRRRIPIMAVVVTALAQGCLAAGVALGGSPLVGAVAAIALALCGLMMVLAASLQS